MEARAGEGERVEVQAQDRKDDVEAGSAAPDVDGHSAIGKATTAAPVRTREIWSTAQVCPFDVGAIVRVKYEQVARRATVACVQSDGKIEISFDDDGSDFVASLADISPLQEFERAPPRCRGDGFLDEDVARCREEGNTLYRLGDAAAAAERYSAAIEALGTVESGVSLCVLAVLDRTMWLANGDWESGVQDGWLRFERPASHQQISQNEPPSARRVLKRSVLHVRGEVLGDMQAALYLNRARCWLSLGAFARVLQDSELVSALLGSLAQSYTVTNGDAGNARLCTACFLRARARLAQGRLKQAEAELQVAATIAPGQSQMTELQRLRREILEARRGNRRLAKEIAKWCEAAMAKASPDALAAMANESAAK